MVRIRLPGGVRGRGRRLPLLLESCDLAENVFISICIRCQRYLKGRYRQGACLLDTMDMYQVGLVD